MSTGLWASIAVVAGVTVGVVGDGLHAAAAGLSVALTGVAVCRPRRLTWVGVLGLAAVAWGGHARDRALGPLPDGLTAHDDGVRLTGILTSDAASTPAGVRLDLRIDGLDLRVVVGGTMGTEAAGGWTRGRTITAPVRVRTPDLIRNPGSPSETWQVLTRRFDLVGSVKSAALVEVAPAAWPEEVAARVRRHVRHSAQRFVGPHAETSQAVVTAILIGDRAGLDDTLMRRLQAAGTFHVIAISGGNIAMLTMACFLFVRMGTRSVRLPPIVTAAVVVAYGYVVGGEPSVTRAVLAAVVYFGLRVAGIPPRPVNLLAVVAVLCVVWEPLTVVDVGAWLSFGATAGLIVVLPRLQASVTAIDSAAGAGMRAWAWCRVAVLGTAAAEIVILPVTAAVFGRVGVAGLLLNVVAVPAMALVQLAGLGVCAAALIWAPAAHGLAWVAHAATVLLLGSSAALDVAPWLSWRVPQSSVWWTAGYYLCVGVALGVARPRWRRGAVAAAAVLAVVIVSSPLVRLRRPPAGWLRVTVLDVGQGDAILVQTPQRHSLLVDAGGTPGGQFDVGGRVVTPAVWALGERRLTWLALSHGDLDHIGGALRIVDDLRPAEIWEGIPVDSSTELQRLRALAQPHGVVWRRLLAGHEVEDGGVVMRVLHPQVPDWQRVRVRNDDSLVIEVRYGEVSVLLTGDAGAEFEAQPMAAARWGRPARLRLLKVAHHGSRSSTRETFVAGFRPQVAMVSAGRSNLFGHPAPDVIERLRGHGATTYRTDRHGAISVETDGREVRVRAAAGPRLWLF